MKVIDGIGAATLDMIRYIDRPMMGKIAVCPCSADFLKQATAYQGFYLLTIFVDDFACLHPLPPTDRLVLRRYPHVLDPRGVEPALDPLPLLLFLLLLMLDVILQMFYRNGLYQCGCPIV